MAVIAIPANARVATIQSDTTLIGAALQSWLQAITANTELLSINTIRSEHSQGVTCIISYVLAP